MKVLLERSKDQGYRTNFSFGFLGGLKLFLIATMAVSFVAFSSSAFSQGADVSGVPSIVNAEVGNNYTVIMQIDASDQEVAAAELLLSFNPSLIQVNTIGFVNGNPLSSALPSPFPGGSNIDNTNGRLYFGGFKTPPAVNVLFNFIEINFTAIATGTSQIDFITSGFPATALSFAGYDVTGGLNAVEINITTVNVDCPALGVNNGDPCLATGQPGEYVNCECLPYDCNGVPGGTGFNDDCGDCVSGNTGLEPCLNCGPGTYELNGECTTCPPGSYCPGDGNSYECPAGEYQSAAGQVECLSCGPGSYSDVTGATECQLCPAGTYQDVFGATECNSCGPGSFSSVEGATECILCPAGTSQGQSGSTYCVACPPGSYSSTIGAEECELCPSGTYQSVSGAIECINCASGTGSDPGATECEIIDCNGDLGGTAFLDNCSTCVGGNTGETACVQDCNGEYGGTASVDDCGECSGGNTGLDPNASCTDCAGVINGDTGPGSLCYDDDEIGIYNSDCICEISEQGFIAGSVPGLNDCGLRTITIAFYNQDYPELNDVYSTTIDANGHFTTPSYITGMYDFYITVDGYLSKLVPDLVLQSGTNDLDITGIIGGDLNNSNTINFVDFSILNAAFGSVDGDPNYNSVADLNCDGYVNFIDFSILNSTYGMEGDTPPGDD